MNRNSLLRNTSKRTTTRANKNIGFHTPYIEMVDKLPPDKQVLEKGSSTTTIQHHPRDPIQSIHLPTCPLAHLPRLHDYQDFRPLALFNFFFWKPKRGRTTLHSAYLCISLHISASCTAEPGKNGRMKASDPPIGLNHFLSPHADCMIVLGPLGAKIGTTQMQCLLHFASPWIVPWAVVKSKKEVSFFKVTNASNAMSTQVFWFSMDFRFLILCRTSWRSLFWHLPTTVSIAYIVANSCSSRIIMVGLTPIPLKVPELRLGLSYL